MECSVPVWKIPAARVRTCGPSEAWPPGPRDAGVTGAQAGRGVGGSVALRWLPCQEHRPLPAPKEGRTLRAQGGVPLQPPRCLHSCGEEEPRAGETSALIRN